MFVDPAYGVSLLVSGTNCWRLGAVLRIWAKVLSLGVPCLAELHYCYAVVLARPLKG